MKKKLEKKTAKFGNSIVKKKFEKPRFKYSAVIIFVRFEITKVFETLSHKNAKASKKMSKI